MVGKEGMDEVPDALCRHPMFSTSRSSVHLGKHRHWSLSSAPSAAPRDLVRFLEMHEVAGQDDRMLDCGRTRYRTSLDPATANAVPIQKPNIHLRMLLLVSRMLSAS